MKHAAIKVAIRQDNKKGVIRAYFSTMDDRQRVEVAALSLALAEEMPGVFEDFKAMLSVALRRLLESKGVEVLGLEEIRPERKN